MTVSVGSFWYEDDPRFEGEAFRDNRQMYERRHPVRHPRATGRIVRVVSIDGENGTVEIQNVGGRWVADKVLGRTTTVKLSRFDKSGGYRSLSPDHFGSIRYLEGAPGAIT